MDGTVRIHRNPIEDNYTSPKSGRQWIFHSIVSMATTDKLHLIRTFSGSWQWQLHCALAFVECIAIMLGAQRCVYATCARKTLLHTKYTYAAWNCCCYIQAKYDCTYVCRAHIYTQMPVACCCCCCCFSEFPCFVYTSNAGTSANSLRACLSNQWKSAVTAAKNPQKYVSKLDAKHNRIKQ